jgi:hypothetical protein
MITLDQKKADALNARRLTAVGSTLTFGAPPDTRSWPLPEGTPEWVRGPSTDEPAFGVGWVRGMDNEALARAAAENRARVDLMERLVKRGRLEKGQPLEGSVITERWFHEKTNTHFAKAELQ